MYAQTTRKFQQIGFYHMLPKRHKQVKLINKLASYSLLISTVVNSYWSLIGYVKLIENYVIQTYSITNSLGKFQVRDSLKKV